MLHRPSAGTRPRLLAATALSCVLTGAGAVPVHAASKPRTAAAGAPKAFLDVRGAAGPAGVATAPSAAKAPGRSSSARTLSARAALRKDLGSRGVLAVDPRTGTPRSVLRLGAALTGASGADRAAIARGYARSNATALGLDSADVDALGTPEVVAGPSGLSTLTFRQAVAGIPAFDNALTASVDRAGRLITLGGSPVHDLAASATTPTLSATAALRAIAGSVGATSVPAVSSAATGPRRATRFANGDMARLVLFDLGTGAPARLAWHATYKTAGTAWYDAVVDAATGRVLYRADLTRSAADASVYRNYPGAPAPGGTPVTVDLEARGYLAPGADQLKGPNAHAYSDVDASDDPSEGELVRRTPGGSFTYPLTPFTGAPAFAGGSRCETFAICVWDSSVPSSWTTNRAQTTVQEFYFNNVFHDHLATAPIGFDKASGNFEGDDFVISESDDGAAVPIEKRGAFLNNANMGTPPDGQSPTMQMYLNAYDTRPYEDPENDYSGLFRDNNNSDDATTVYHEYTHGLTSRLVKNADGSQALDAAQSGAMGEAWSDWYAFDFVVRDGLLQDDAATPGQLNLGAYSDAIPNIVRSEPIDCPVGSGAPACPGTPGAGPGGYTYGDFGRVNSGLRDGAVVIGGPEVHADGEIWAQTLWDLREALVAKTGSQTAGSDAAERLVTGGLRLSPPQPTMLDQRNAIIQTDTAMNGGANVALLWQVFAKRGMGYFAAVGGGTDTAPVEDFSLPPAASAPKGTLKGTVVDQDSGLGVAGSRVGIGGLSTPGFAGALAGTTATGGAYSFGGIPEHVYPKVVLEPGPGYFSQQITDVAITGGQTTTKDATVRKTYAFGGKATETIPLGEEYGCGVSKLNDASTGTVWEVEPPAPGGPFPTATIELAAPTDVTSFGIDPSEGCGSSGDAQLKDYKLESSVDGTTWVTVTEGTFSPADAHKLNAFPPAGDGKGVRFVRLTAKSAQDNSYGYLDVAELAVFGGPPNVLPTGTLTASPGTVAPGGSVAFNAASFTDPDSAITGYDWDYDGNGTVDESTAGPVVNHAYGVVGNFTAKVAVKDFRGGAGSGSAAVTVAAAPVGGGGGGAPGGGGSTGGGTTGGGTTGGVTKVTTKLLQRLRRGEVRVGVACPSAVPCRAKTTLLLTALDARRLRLARTRVTKTTSAITKQRTVAVAVGAVVLRKARARRQTAVKVTVRVVVTPKTGKAVTKTYVVRLGT
ncbi:hypothetical protein DSM112329_02124 [Paraconexibacter sp. AEG42_29]|uniref:PKD domain-containing protein n=1 Tax=Paraconexibacter sp. AEG42_29 TaxID=2997339 RepID=A0AAU7AUE8_9ACTN